MDFKDYYQLMDVERSASQDEIKRAYRKLARKYHPDVSKEADAEERFKEVGEAYEVLKDPEKRAAYDELGANWKGGQDFNPPPGWDQGFEFHGGGYTERDPEQFSDFFESLFGSSFAGGGGGQAQRKGAGYSMRGEDAYAKAVIELEDAYQGATRAITLRHAELGPDGRPEVKNRTLNVKIPKGIRQSQHIRLAGQGNPGHSGGEAGDLYLEIEFNAHPYYRVEGGDVYLDLPIAPWEAALGATVTAPTPGGNVELKIPAGSASGKKMRLKGRGIPSSSAGDLYVLLQVALPPAKSDEARDLYKQMEQKMAFNPRAALGV
ncbi:MAG: J domain-containing protein [Gammaproteobacteria bacterium]|nr:MAG: J domain-containing protein [Gammaproteobacteria bacterium]